MSKYLAAWLVMGWLGVVGTTHADPQAMQQRVRQLSDELKVAKTNLRMSRLDAPPSEEQWRRGVEALANIRQKMKSALQVQGEDPRITALLVKLDQRIASELPQLDQQAKEIRLVLDVRHNLQAAEDAARANRLTADVVNAATASVDRFESGMPPQLRSAASDYRAKIAAWQGATGDKPLQELPAVSHVLSLLLKTPVSPEPSLAETVQLFMQAPAGAFLFSIADESHLYRGCGPADDARRIRFGEALLLLDGRRGPTYENGMPLRLLTVDGRVAEVDRDRVAPTPPRARPLDLTVDDLIVREAGGRPIAVLLADSEIECAPDFLKVLAESDPRRTQFLAAQQKASQCYDTEMRRLDPDNRRGNYDIVKPRASFILMLTPYRPDASPAPSLPA